MSNKSRKKPPAWLQQQAQIQRAEQLRRLAARTEENDQSEKAKQMFTELINSVLTSQGKIQRLAVAYADRCWRVHELYQVFKAEFDRAEQAEARAANLQHRLDQALAQIEQSRSAGDNANAEEN